MRSFVLSPLLILIVVFLTSGTPAAAQWPVPIVLEARGGYAIPRGEFGRGEAGARPQAGPRFGVGGRIVLSRLLAVYGLYHQSRFGCANCSELGLENAMVSRAGEIGIEIRPLPEGWLGAQPWFRGGAVYQTLGFAAGDQTMTSRGDLGFSFGGGVAVSVFGPLELMPGVGFAVMPAEFDFAFAPAHSMEVRSLILELGAAVRLGGRRE